VSEYTYSKVYSSIDDDEKAFPLTGYSPHNQYGMSLRDWFAGQALVGMLASEGGTDCGFYAPRAAADRAYQMADAMLEARKESK
jgi:hypothetical protein